MHLLGYDRAGWGSAAAFIAPNSLDENLLGSHHLQKCIARLYLAHQVISVGASLASRSDGGDFLAELGGGLQGMSRSLCHLFALLSLATAEVDVKVWRHCAVCWGLLINLLGCDLIRLVKVGIGRIV